MSIYRIEHDLRYQYLATMSDQEARKFPRFNGKSVQDKWHSDLRIRLITEDFNRLGVDFPYLLYGGVLVCSGKAWTQLKSLLTENVEVFPLNCDDGEFYALNVLNVSDCFDLSRSEFERLDDGSISAILKMVFMPGCYGEKAIFKIPEWVLTDIFVTERFKEIVEQNELKGLIFKQIEV